MTDTNTETAAPASPTPAAPFSADDITRVFFSNDENSLAQAAELLQKIQALTPPVPVHYNFDFEKDDLPAGYGISVVPVKERDEKENKNVLVGVTFYAVPTFETVMSDPKGADYIREALYSAFAAKQANSIRPNRDGVLAAKPFTLADYIERKQRGDSYKTFNTMKRDLVAALRQIGLKTINAQVLRQCFSNAAIAESQYPAVPQDSWVRLLEMAAAKAEAGKLDPTIYHTWAATRQDAEAHDDEIDFDQLDKMLA